MLALTPARLAAVYDMLRAFPPFDRWRLPPGKDVKFRVLRRKDFQAQWWIEGDRHHIDVCAPKHYRIDNLAATMAHEMLHVRQRLNGTETRGAEHNVEFNRLAALVCKKLGFDLGQFNG